MDDRQHSEPLVRKPASGVIDLSQITVAAFDSGRGPLKGFNSLLSPLAPLGQVVRTELLSIVMDVERVTRLLGQPLIEPFQVRMIGSGALRFPVEPRQQHGADPLIGFCTQRFAKQASIHPSPPEIDASRNRFELTLTFTEAIRGILNPEVVFQVL